MKRIIIAIDGYSACGKSTTARVVAKKLKYAYIDSGAMYRAVTLYFHQNHIQLTNSKAVDTALANISIVFKTSKDSEICDTYLNGLNVEKEIRRMEISQRVSRVSTIVAVRKAMVAQQRILGDKHGVVMDGRDIGTVVFPNAELKVFMEAEFYVRAQRRQQELLQADQLVDLKTVIANLRSRDHLDSTRKESPLCKAEDAVLIDTTHLTLEEQAEEVLYLATTKIAQLISKNCSE